MSGLRGFTLIELAVIIGIIAVLAAIGLLRAGSGADQDKEAALANSIQASLQTALGQAALRTENTPAQAFAQYRPNMLQFASIGLQANTPLTVTGGGFHLAFNNSGRFVDYNLNAMGDVVINNENFSSYNIGPAGQLVLP